MISNRLATSLLSLDALNSHHVLEDMETPKYIIRSLIDNISTVNTGALNHSVSTGCSSKFGMHTLYGGKIWWQQYFGKLYG